MRPTSPKHPRRSPWALVLALALGGCSCGKSPLNSASGNLVAAPAALHFSATFAGYSSSLELELTNQGRSPHHATLAVSAPFAVAHEGLQVEGAATARVAVAFAPDGAGPASGVLTVSTDEQTITIALDGAGLAQPVCTASGVCRSSQFELDAGVCVEGNLPEDAPCGSASGCLSAARCVQGQCLGQAATCDDGDACTEDACDVASGCIHFDTRARCPAPADGCHVPICTPEQGCGVAEAADGTLCGPANCDTAAICLAGRCQTVAVPEGFECAPPSPCQAAGACHNHLCVQPPATELVPAWSYDPSPGWIDTAPFADEAGNAYWFEIDDNASQLVSATPQGFIRYRILESFDTAFLVGQVLVTGAETSSGYSWRGYQTRDGSLLWQRDAKTDALAAFGDAGSAHLDLEYARAGSAGATQAWFQYQLGRPDATLSDLEQLGALAVGVDALSGSTTWQTRILDAGALINIGFTSLLETGVADEADDLYLVLTNPQHQNVLVSLSSSGVERWRRQVDSAPSAAYGGLLAAVPLVLDGGAPSEISCIDGSSLATLDLQGITSSPVLTVFDGAAGVSVAPIDAGVIYGDCNDQLVPFALFGWDLASGAMRYHLPVGPYFDANSRPTSVTLLDDRSVLLPDWRVQCLADGGQGDAWTTRLRRISLGGEELFSCPATGIGAMIPLTGSRWLTAADPVDHTVIEAFDLPGVTAMPHGWISQKGNPGGGDAPR